MTLEWGLSDLQKLEINGCAVSNVGGLKSSDHRSKEIKVLDDLVVTNGIVVKGGEEALSKTIAEKDSRVVSLEKLVEQDKNIQEIEMKEFNENHAKNMKKLDEECEREINEADRNFKIKITEIIEKNEGSKQVITTPTKENLNISYCQSYIRQVCLILQANMYHIVLPDQFAEDLPYKVKDIEEDKDFLDEDERQKAWKRWESLKEKLCWDPPLKRTLKMLQKEGNSMNKPEVLTVEEAERVAEELNKQGRLRGRTSYKKVKKIIKMWKISTTLV
ncbi:uncharacterized protein LOC116305005 [Actinia tenebrosa]|uniref:Uncharacterized protein LOC116305005 n=1 Tax=Actinia tenebrosa TaxID=6105 RepID=A0A6P8IUE8_ACTTE|nr:uncharacterized protein LOC116305005 [Actinia tenebrosa]